MVSESGARLPPLIGKAVSCIYADMVIVGELTQTVETSTAAAVHAPDDIALSESAAAEHFSFCRKLVVSYIVAAKIGQPAASSAP